MWKSGLLNTNDIIVLYQITIQLRTVVCILYNIITVYTDLLHIHTTTLQYTVYREMSVLLGRSYILSVVEESMMVDSVALLVTNS